MQSLRFTIRCTRRHVRVERLGRTSLPSVASSRFAFTLLEVIIAMTLTATLMLIVWSLFSTFTKLEERSTRTAIELQLVRSVSQQLRSDLEHFAVLPISGTASASSGSSTSEATTEPDVDTTEDESEEPNEGEQDSPDDADDANLDEDSSSVRSVNSINATVPNATTEPLGSSVTVDMNLDAGDISQPSVLSSSLPSRTHLRGTATRLEFATRLPYTVDVPTGRQLLGAETRYGTHQLVLYEWRDERKLATLLTDDPVLNPAKWNPPKPLNPNDPVPVAQPLNPNDNVGLIREMKSWLHVTRDRRMQELRQQAEAAGLLVDGQLPGTSATTGLASPFPTNTPPANTLSATTFPSNANSSGTSTVASITRSNSASFGSGDRTLESLWHPPPEFRHKRDHIPEVTRLQFRYLSQDTWLLEWNRQDQLPRAIEIAFDLDPDAPAVRAKKFEAAHALMVNGQSMGQVLPPEELEQEDELLAEQDPLLALNLEDPTAIVTEYRFVILLPQRIVPDDDRGSEAERIEPSAAAEREPSSQNSVPTTQAEPSFVGGGL